MKPLITLQRTQLRHLHLAPVLMPAEPPHRRRLRDPLERKWRDPAHAVQLAQREEERGEAAEREDAQEDAEKDHKALDLGDRLRRVDARSRADRALVSDPMRWRRRCCSAILRGRRLRWVSTRR